MKLKFTVGLLIVLVVVGGVLLGFSSKDDMHSVGEGVEYSIQYDKTGEVKVIASNRGDTESKYVRIRIDSNVPLKQLENSLNSDWVKNGDFYYYTKLLKVGEDSTSLFNGLKANDEYKIDGKYTLRIVEGSNKDGSGYKSYEQAYNLK